MKELPSIMFHDLHDNYDKGTQGSVNNKEFYKILDFIQEKENITNASELNGLSEKEILTKLFITFDDGLKSQHEIGAKILNAKRITACFFIHTAPLNNDFDVHQILRIFRNSSIFNSVEDFNKIFLEYLFKNIDEKKHAEINLLFDDSSYLSQFTFYSLNDRKLRYIRDFHLSHNEYKDLSLDFIRNNNADVDSLIKETYMNEESILNLHRKGHHIGLHSHSHASNLKSLSEDEQKEEIQKNMLTDFGQIRSKRIKG